MCENQGELEDLTLWGYCYDMNITSVMDRLSAGPVKVSMDSYI